LKEAYGRPIRQRRSWSEGIKVLASATVRNNAPGLGGIKKESNRPRSPWSYLTAVDVRPSLQRAAGAWPETLTC
jgi:hypothetical protein